MPNPERRKPNPHHRSSALRKNSNHIITEILGMVAAALIFTATVLTSAFGMTGAFDHQEAIVMAGVIDDGR